MIQIPDTATLEDAKRLVLLAALERNGGNRDKSARELGVARSTVFKLIDQWDIDVRGTR